MAAPFSTPPPRSGCRCRGSPAGPPSRCAGAPRSTSARSPAPRTATDANGPAHPEQVAAYLAKYLTKACEDFGLPRRVPTARHAAAAGTSPHAVRIVQTAERLAAEGDPVDYERLGACLATLGYRGHPVTKSHRFSVTFGRLRRARAEHHRRKQGLDPDAEIRELLDVDPDDQADVIEVREWTYAGRGYLDTDTAANAVRSACLARSRRAALDALA